MHMKHRIVSVCASCAITLAMADAAPAEMIVLTTVDGQGADAYVRSGQPEVNFGDQPNVTVKYTGADSTFNRKGYLRFDLGTLTQPVTGATFHLTVSQNNGGALRPNDSQSFTFEVFGLSDGHVGEAWVESAINWNNAPANASVNSLLTGPGQAVSLGTFGIDTASLATTVLALAGESLVSFLNDDTDGLVTFIIRRIGHSGTSNAAHSNSGFASKEHQELPSATLTIMSSALLLGDMNRDGAVDTADVAPFVQALTNPQAYTDQYGIDPALGGDINEDGAFDTADVAPFVQLLVGEASQSVPEPGTLALLGGLLLLLRRPGTRVKAARNRGSGGRVKPQGLRTGPSQGSLA